MKIKSKMWLIAISLIFAGCSSSLQSSNAPISNSKAEPEQDIYLPRAQAAMKERIRLERQMTEFLNNTNLVFSIRTESQDNNYEYFGNGFIIKNGIITTTNHLINNRVKPSILINDKRQKVEVLNKVHTRDLAFLGIKKSALPAFSVKFTSAQSIFESLSKNKDGVALKETLVGAKCVFDTHTKIIIGELSSWNSENNEVGFLIDGGDPQGCSGAPVFTLENLIIGIFQSHAGRMKFALDIQDVMEALEIIEKNN